MISFLEGTIEYLGDKYAILNAGGIGYKVTISPKLLNILSDYKGLVKARGPERSEGQAPKIRLHIHSQLNMREGTFDLYGFDTREGLDLFHLLTSVNGIGPKNAMGILAVVEPRQLKAAVVKDDDDYLRKVSGLGPKTAKRLILELKNKVDYLDASDVSNVNLGQEGQVMEALLTLGYSPNQAKEALKDAKGDTLEQKVGDALKILGKR